MSNKPKRKKRRVREPFIVITKWNDEVRERTVWDFDGETVDKRERKSCENHMKYFPENTSELISVKPYPNCYSVSIDEGQHTRLISVDAYTEEEAEKIAQDKHPSKKIISVKETIQVIT